MALRLMAAVLAVAVWGGRPSARPSRTTGDRKRRSPAAVRSRGWVPAAPVTAPVGAMTLVEWPLATTFAAIVAAAWTWSCWWAGGVTPRAGGIESRAAPAAAGVSPRSPAWRLACWSRSCGTAPVPRRHPEPAARLSPLGPAARRACRWRGRGSPRCSSPRASGWRSGASGARRPHGRCCWLAATVVVLSADGWAFPPRYRVLLIVLPIAPPRRPRRSCRWPGRPWPRRARRRVPSRGSPGPWRRRTVPGALFCGVPRSGPQRRSSSSPR